MDGVALERLAWDCCILQMEAEIRTLPRRLVRLIEEV